MSIVYIIRGVCQGQGCKEVIDDYIAPEWVLSGKARRMLIRILEERGWIREKNTENWYCPKCAKFLNIKG